MNKTMTLLISTVVDMVIQNHSNPYQKTII